MRVDPEYYSTWLTPRTLKQIGKKCFGDMWVPKVAKWLGVNRSTVHRWAKGDDGAPKKYDKDVKAMVEANEKLKEIIKRYGQ